MDEAVHQFVVDLGKGLKHRFPRCIEPALQGRGYLRRRIFEAHAVGLIEQGYACDQVQNALELVPVLYGDLQGDGVRLQDVPHHGDAVAQVCARPVHLVDEGDAGHAVAVRLPPYGLRLGLHAFDAGEKGDRAVEDAERPADFHGEIDMAGRVDDIDAVVPPETGRRCRGDGDAALLLLFHPVHGGRALVHLADPVVDARVEEYPLSRRCLSGIDMRHDADVSDNFLHLPPVMGERLVGLCHLVRIFPLLYGPAPVVVSVHNLACELLDHGLLGALPGIA